MGALTSHYAADKIRNMRSWTVLRLTLAIAILLAALMVSGCGGGDRADIAVNVAGHTISRSEVSRWTRIEAIVSHEFVPKAAPPKGIVPDPPAFTSCIAYLAALLHKGKASHAVSSERPQLKSACVAHLRLLQEHVLEILIDYQWSSKAGHEQGIQLTPHEVTTVLRNLYSNEEEIRRLLAISGEKYTDLRLLAERNLFVAKLLKHEEAAVDATHPRTRKQREQQLISRATEFTKRWKAHTDCQPGYVIGLCKQYTGSLNLMLP